MGAAGGGYPVASQIRPRCHLRATIRSYLLTPSFPARATLGSQSLGGAALQEGKSRRVVLASVGALHLPAAPVPPLPPRPVHRRVVGAGAGHRLGAGSRRQPPSPRAAWFWKVGAAVGTPGSAGVSTAPSPAGYRTPSLRQPPSALRSGGDRAPRGRRATQVCCPPRMGAGRARAIAAFTRRRPRKAPSCTRQAAVLPQLRTARSDSPRRRGVSHRARAPPGCCGESPLPPAPGSTGPGRYLVGGAPGAAAAPSAGSILGSGVRLAGGRRAAAGAAASSASRALLLGLPPPASSTASARPSRAPLHGPGARAQDRSAS